MFHSFFCFKSLENMKVKCSLFLLCSLIISTAFSGVTRNSGFDTDNDAKVRGCGKFLI